MQTLSERAARWRKENPDYKPAAPQNPFQRWLHKDTRKTAVEAMCWQCMGGTEADFRGVREQIRDCTCDGRDGTSKCPLYNWRPYK